jgi:hypothetical protein
MCQKEIIPILYNLFQKKEIEELFPRTFYEVSITLIPKPEKDIARKEEKKTL